MWMRRATAFPEAVFAVFIMPATGRTQISVAHRKDTRWESAPVDGFE